MSDWNVTTQVIKNIKTSFEDSLAPVFRTAQRIGKSYQRIVSENRLQIQETLKRISEGFIETEEDLKVFKVAIIDLGYPPHEGMGIWNMREIAKMYTEDKSTLEETIDYIMCEYYDDEFFTELGRMWENYEVLQNRLPILRNVIMAHNLGMYNVSIPAIIAQLEGVLIDSFEIKGYVNGVIIKMLLKELLKEEDSGFDFDGEIRKYYEKNILADFERGKIIKSDVSRNAILHGADITYGKQIVSIKAILLFDTIATKLLHLDEEVRIKGKNKAESYQREQKRKRQNRNKKNPRRKNRNKKNYEPR